MNAVVDGPACWRGECRSGCYYPATCSEIPAAVPLPPVPDVREAVAAAVHGVWFGPGRAPWYAETEQMREWFGTVADAVLSIPAIATALGEQP